MMIAPVYVFMRRNEKFVSVKSPLDFFTPEEIQRLKNVETFFMPDFVDSVLPYRTIARRVKMMLGWLPPASYELADGALRVMAPLWGTKLRIEPFFVCVFVNELCPLLPGEELTAAREKDVAALERAIILSAWMVFFSLHIGAADQGYLERIRLASFRKALGTQPAEPGTISLESHSDAGELFRILNEMLPSGNVGAPFDASAFAARGERVAQKIIARLNRVHSENLIGSAPLDGTIYGERGFADG